MILKIKNNAIGHKPMMTKRWHKVSRSNGKNKNDYNLKYYDTHVNAMTKKYAKSKDLLEISLLS